MNASEYRKNLCIPFANMRVIGEENIRKDLIETAEASMGNIRYSSSLIYSALALLAFGMTKHFGEAITLLAQDPSRAENVPVRPFVRIIVDLFPLPLNLRPNDFQAVQSWYMANQNRLVWNETEGKFMIAPDANGCL